MSASLQWTDHRGDPTAWATQLGCSVEACELVLQADFIDLHLDLEVPIRVFGWKPERHHGIDDRTRWWFGHTDYPRLREAGFTGVAYDIATNPFRPKGNRLAITLSNIERARQRIASFPDELQLVVDRTGYDEARVAGKLAMWLTLQGGNALSADLSVLDGEVGDVLHRITLIHLTNSDLGGSNSPNGGNKGITDLGREFVQRCNAKRVLVDLAHSSKATFWDALDCHSAELPPIVSHTGVEGVRPHWRNVDDDQLRAIGDRGGVVGIMYQSHFLAPVWTTCARSAIVDHLAHVIDVVGEDVPAIGTDYDGMITPPHDLPDVTHHPLLVQDMLDRGWTAERIQKILGRNYLRVVRAIRPGPPPG